MKSLFIDTNILIDLLLKREGYEAAARIFALSDNPSYSLNVSVLTMANIAYILRKVLQGDKLYEELEHLSTIFQVQPMTTVDYEAAVALKAKDFEDALQYYCALSSQCDVIITRNEKDFAFSKLKVVSPNLFLADLL